MGPCIVVLDVNIFLDVVRSVGGVCSLTQIVNLCASGDKRSALHLFSYLRSGKRPSGEVFEVWTSDHINRLVALKASQPKNAADERDRGLGLSEADAQSLVDDLVWPLVDATGGDIVHVNRSSESPPLDHEDGLVHATARHAGHEGVLYDRRFCITRDTGFLDAATGLVVEKSHPDDWIIEHRRLASEARIKAVIRATAT